MKRYRNLRPMPGALGTVAGMGISGLLEDRFVGDIEGRFFIPAYQRGYRWGVEEVKRLLEDIAESRHQSTYYLQPIVVKPMADGQWELVDGQQRLTTLFLILQDIRRSLPSAKVQFELEYETRGGSEEYLKEPDEAGSTRNIDFFHIHKAASTIRSWFESLGSGETQAAIDFYTDLSRRVKVIWYEAPVGMDSTDLFTRLNIGRIPLTDAELVKALLLTRARGHVDEPDRSQETAAQWDILERDLRAPELWAFVTGHANSHSNHIALLLDNLAGASTGHETTTFKTFDSLRAEIDSDYKIFWNKVLDLHSLIVGWYEDRDLFHKVGYLVATGTPFGKLVAVAAGRTKSSFEASLDDMIKTKLDLTDTALSGLSYESPAGRERATQALLLMNVETIRKMQHSSERYSFRAHAAGAWSLEHIHAQNAEALNTAEQWTSWLRLHRDALVGLPIDEERRHDMIRRIDDALPTISRHTFPELQREVNAIFSSGDEGAEGDVHVIDNLALLDGRDNSALSNAVFEVKRLEILRRDRVGSYIPVCTRNVFLKYYTEEGTQQIHFWSAADRRAYLDAFRSEIGRYLMEEVSEA
ncbi:DUF262 domain-containing HNH endonuclease family protein [Arthrobacter sp. R1-13]